MPSLHHIVWALIVCVLMQKALTQETADFAEEYIDEDLPESSADTEAAAAPKAPKAPKNETNELNGHKKTNFTDDRFTKLFQPRNRPQQSPLFPKFNAKAKPTLPPFIKGTPPNIKPQPVTQSPQIAQRFNQRSTAPTQRTTTTRTPARGSVTAGNRRNANTNNRGLPSTTASPTSTTDSSSRRRFGGSVGNRRQFNVNSTIPATSRPRRN